jgi:hypothetical protein
MAQQRGIVKFKGSLDDLTFLKTKDGYEARLKSSLNKERIQSDPKFARTRENGREFGRAAKSGKLVRMAFADITTARDGRMISRLHKEMMFCLQADTTHDRGLRTVSDGDPLLLKGFDFNVAAPLSTVLKVIPTCTVDRPTGALDILLPAFVPTTSLSVPAGATHYKIVAGGAAVDFDAESFEADSSESGYLAITNVLSTPLTLSATVPVNSTLPIYQVLGIHFYQEMNGKKYALNSSNTDPVAIVNADI